MKVQLINLGRNNVNEIVHVRDQAALERLISRNVFYDDWEFEQSPREENEYYVIHGMDVIGTIKTLES